MIKPAIRRPGTSSNNLTLKRSFISREKVFNDKFDSYKQREREKRKTKEKLLESIPSKSDITKPFAGIAAKGKGMLDTLLNFLGTILVGWLINNLPAIIKFVENLIERIKKLFKTLKQFISNLTTTLKKFTNVIGAYTQNLKEFDFFDTKGRVKKATEELEESFEAMKNDLNEAMGLLTTPLGQDGVSGGTSGPGLQGLSSYIMQAESGTNYNVIAGGEVDPNLTSMNLGEIIRKYEGQAVGAPQFKPATASGLARQMGEDPNAFVYSPENQRKLHQFHLRKLGYDKFKSGQMTAEQFGTNIAQQYRALPDPRTGRTYADQYSRYNTAQVSLPSFMSQLERSKQASTQTGGSVTGYVTGDTTHPNYAADHDGDNYHEHFGFASTAEKDRAKAALESAGFVITSEYRPMDTNSAHGQNRALDVGFYPSGLTKGYSDDRAGTTAFSRDVRNVLLSAGFSGVGIGQSPITPAQTSQPETQVRPLQSERRGQTVIVIEEEQPTAAVPIGGSDGGVIIVPDNSLNRLKKQQFLNSLQ
jgi:hypothetical protein